MKGEILRNLLDAQQRLCIPGLGRFASEVRSAEIQFGSGGILPPSARIEFSRRPQEDSSELRDYLINQYGLAASRAEELIEKFVSEVRTALAGNQRYSIPAFGTLTSDLEGNIHFFPEEKQIFNLSAFGLLPIEAKALALQNRISNPGHEAPVIPLRPFEDKTAKRSRISYLAYAAVGAGLAMAAGSLIWISSLGTETGQQASVLPLSQPVKVEISAEKSVPRTLAPTGNALPSSAPVSSESALKFFVVAGSFRNPAVALEAEKCWKKAGFVTSVHSLEEKQMSRIAIGEFASKEDALVFMAKSQPEFPSQLWILKEQI